MTDSADSAVVVQAALSDGVQVDCVDSDGGVFEAIDEGPYEVVLLDYGQPRARALLEQLRQACADVDVVVLSAGGVNEAVEAMRMGAADVVPRPVQQDEIRRALRQVIGANRQYDEPPPSGLSQRGLIGESKAMEQVRSMIRRASPTTATVLIRGESGTGKELVARAIHEQSPRREEPFIKVHCGGLPDTLLESEMFGYEKGAFTGATARKPGRVEVAEGGTLFLDEIGDVTVAMQVKLLRLLQDREYERLGSTETRKVDIRFIAATHRDLERMVKREQFREDLFYRLNVLPLWLPPLRARRDDIELLARHYCQAFGEANGRPEMRLGEDALQALRAHRWPGNVRQLQNLVERLVILCENDTISEDDVERELHQNRPFSTHATIPLRRRPRSHRIPPAWLGCRSCR